MSVHDVLREAGVRVGRVGMRRDAATDTYACTVQGVLGGKKTRVLGVKNTPGAAVEAALVNLAVYFGIINGDLS